MRITILFSTLCLATACSGGNPVTNTFGPQAKAERAATKRAVADKSAVQAGFAPSQPGGLEMPRIDPVEVSRPGAALPPADDQYRYIGRWAASPAMCAGQSWRFLTRRLTAGNVDCDLPTVANVPGGYELQGTCKGPGGKLEQTLKLRFDEPHRTLRVAGKTLGPIDLIYCGA